MQLILEYDSVLELVKKLAGMFEMFIGVDKRKN
jgi:hypothetical protein